MASRDLASKLLDLSDQPTPQRQAAIRTALTPRIVAANRDDRAEAATARASRESLLAHLTGGLVGEELAAVLGDSTEVRERIGAILNATYPPRKPITTEFLDLLVARVQRLEACVRLLANTVAELLHPSDRDVPSVSVSSAGRRRS